MENSLIKLSSEGLVRVMQLFLGNCNGGYMSYCICQNPQQCTTRRVNFKLGIIVDNVPVWLISCNKCTALLQDVNSRGQCGGGGGVGILNPMYLLSAQYICKFNSVLTNIH